MVTIIFSDTHLTYRFSKKTFRYLKRIISSADKVIINGDFWDGYFVRFDRFIKSKWSGLFPILKSKKTVYLYGNHDRRAWCNDKVSLFSEEQVETLEMKVGQKTLRIEHGNRITPAPDDVYPWVTSKTMKLLAVSANILLGRLLSTSAGRKYRRRYNKKMKTWWKEQKKDSQVLICGHSHFSEYNLSARYINTGFIRYGYGHYLKITDDKLELVEERYYLR